MYKKSVNIVKIIFGIALFVLAMGYYGYTETHYQRTGFIKHTETPNLYTFVDSTGNVWEFVDDEMIIPYNTVIKASVKMHTKGTIDDITDDEILNIDILSVSNSKNKK